MTLSLPLMTMTSWRASRSAQLPHRISHDCQLYTCTALSFIFNFTPVFGTDQRHTVLRSGQGKFPLLIGTKPFCINHQRQLYTCAVVRSLLAGILSASGLCLTCNVVVILTTTPVFSCFMACQMHMHMLLARLALLSPSMLCSSSQISLMSQTGKALEG